MIFLALFLFAGQARVVESVMPSLTYSRSCSTTIEVRNLANRAVDAIAEPHRESGSLVQVLEQTGLSFHLFPGEQKTFTLKIPEVTENAWIAVREIVPLLELSPSWRYAHFKPERDGWRGSAAALFTPVS
jgi:hypothetical protein